MCSVIHLCDVINLLIPVQNENYLLYFNSNSSNLDRYVRVFLMGENKPGYIFILIFNFIVICYCLYCICFRHKGNDMDQYLRIVAYVPKHSISNLGPRLNMFKIPCIRDLTYCMG